jgi:hypothetical protein
MKLRSFYFMVVFAGLVSCSDDEPANDTPLLTVSAAAGSLASETWIFLTEEDGTLIEAKEITGDGADVVFERPSGFTDERFVVHQLTRSASNSRGFLMGSYTGITGGELSFNAIDPGTGLTEVGKHNYTFTDVPFGYSPRVTGPKVISNSAGGVNGTFSGTTTLGANNIDLLFWFEQGGNPLVVPKYTLVENVSAGETLSMSFNDLTPASEQTVTFSAKQDFVTVYMGPVSPEVLTIPLYTGLTWSNATDIKLYHPGEAFNEYLTIIQTQLGNDRQEYIKTGSIPTSFKSMPATITSLAQEATRITVTTSGAYDYLIASGYNRWTDNALEYTLSWAVYMDDTATKTFTIPDLPGVIVARHPALSSAPLTGFNFIEIRDLNSLDNYSDFLSLFWNAEAFPPDTESFSRAKSYFK